MNRQAAKGPFEEEKNTLRTGLGESLGGRKITLANALSDQYVPCGIRAYTASLFRGCEIFINCSCAFACCPLGSPRGPAMW